MPNRNSLRIGIVGAGTAGLAAAAALARAGHRLTVFEKHAAMAPLGAGLLIQPQGVAALEALGVGGAFDAASVPVTRLLGTCHRNWTLVDIRYDTVEARGVSRTALSQVRAVLLWEETSVVPSGENRRCQIFSPRICSHSPRGSPVVGSQIRIDESLSTLHPTARVES